MKKIIFFGLIFFAIQSRADFLLELGGAYASGAIKTPTSTTDSNTFYNLGFLFTLNKGIWGGWNYSGYSSSDVATATTTFSSTDTGPYMKWQFGKDGAYNMGFAYNLSSTGKYVSGATNETWQGTSLCLQIGVTPAISDTIHVGANLNYYSASYSKKTVSNTESSASNSKSWIFPTIVIMKQW